MTKKVCYKCNTITWKYIIIGDEYPCCLPCLAAEIDIDKLIDKYQREKYV